jgi:6,7-dimethyl-8-ribityllumazine synthase
LIVDDVVGGRPPHTVGVAVAMFNEAITGKLLSGALTALRDLGVDRVVVMRVPGALELGIACQALLRAGCEAAVAVGAVIKGETDHYEYVSTEASRAVTEVALAHGRPVGNAVLTVREYEQAVDRSLPGPSNKGFEAAHAAVEAFRMLEGLNEAVDRKP